MFKAKARTSLGVPLVAALAMLSGGLLAKEAYGQTPPATLQTVTYIVGFAPLYDTTDDHRFSFLSEDIPKLILQEISVLPDRHLDDPTATNYENIETWKAIVAKNTEISTNLTSKSSAFFNPTLLGDARQNQINAAQTAINTGKKSLDALYAGTNYTAHNWRTPIACAFFSGQKASAIVTQSWTTLAQIDSIATTNSIGLVVTGKISAFDRLAYLQVIGYDSYLSAQVIRLEYYFDTSETALVSHRIAEELIKYLASSPFAKVDITTKPESTSLYYNGSLDPSGIKTLYFFKEGRVEIEATAPGYKSSNTSISYKLGDSKTLGITLQKGVTGTAKLTSELPNVDITIDSIPSGHTPQEIGLSGDKEIVRASKDKMESTTTILPSEGNIEYNFVLRPDDLLGPQGRITAKKNSFYSALGWFSIGLPVTMLSLGLYSGYSSAYSRSSNSALLAGQNISLGALIAAGSATSLAAVFTVITLFSYLNTAESP